MKVSIDTNVLLDTPEIVFDTSKEISISFTVIRELDKLKRNPDLKRAAQTALKNIWHLYKSNKIEILNIPEEVNLSELTPDETIVRDTKNANLKILTNDIGMRIIAKARNVDVLEAYEDETIDYDYTGIITVKGDVNYEQNFIQIKELLIDEFNEIFQVQLKRHQYCIIDRIVEKNDIWVRNDNKVQRISQSMKPFRDAGITDSPLDSEQMCALHAVFNSEVPLTVISGKIGSGKTLLSLIGALACTRGQKRFKCYDKIYITRPPISVDTRMRVGYLPGDLTDKLGDWVGGIKSNLKYLLEKTDLNKKEKISDEVFFEYFEIINIDSMQGVSLHNTILLVDEFQLLSEDTLKLILSRISEGSKVVLIGDFNSQTYGINRGVEGFKVLLKHLGTSDDMNFIKLQNIYRSKLAVFVDKIFK